MIVSVQTSAKAVRSGPDKVPFRHEFHERRLTMNLGLFVLLMMAPILIYGGYMTNRSRKHERERRHPRDPR